MREYLFHGKRTDNGEWVEGLLTIMWGQYHIINPDDENTAYPVDPETVGMYTFLQDKHNRRIFEGHIIIATTPDKTATGIFKIGIGEVEADGYKVIEVYGEDRNGKRGDMVAGASECYEIIGNIYDNPELLEVRK